MNEKFRMLDLFSGIVSPVIIDFQGYPGVHSSRYYARLLAPFILSPVEKQRKQANDYEGRITEKKDFRQRQGSLYWSGCTQEGVK